MPLKGGATRNHAILVAALQTLVMEPSGVACQPAQISEPLPVLQLEGSLLNDIGNSIEGAHIQIWQTDPNGNYNHPAGLPNAVEDLDPSFQYFGTSTTNVNGTYRFLTHRPGVYPARPISHIHFRVWSPDKQDLWLTSQLYFRDSEASEQQPDVLRLDLEEQEGSTGPTVLRAEKQIVVDLGLAPEGASTGDFPLVTPSQQAGPFYPVEDFFGLDGDLMNFSIDERNILGVPPLKPDTLEPNNPPHPAPTESPTMDKTDLPTTPPASSASPSRAGILAGLLSLGFLGLAFGP